VFSDRPDAEDLKKFIYPSQLETLYGGTAPKVTKYWPPTMPVMTELNEDINLPNIEIIPRN